MTRACVIGAGIGGLALAIRLQSSGVETTLIEARDRPGGQVCGWQREGFSFDCGPARIGDPAGLTDLWQLSGHDMADDIELLPVERFRRLAWIDGTTLDLSGDADALRREIARIAPEDVAGYEEFLRWSANALQEGTARLLASPPRDLSSLARAIPVFLRYQAWRSAYGTVSRFVKSEKLREAFTVQALMTGANPLTASVYHALGHKFELDRGAWWPKGGMNGLARAMARQFERVGGTLLLHNPVLHIHTLGDRASEVECVSGWRQRFDAVASSADAVHAYRDLLADNMRGREMARRLMRQHSSPSCFTVYFGLEGSWPGIPHETVLFGPRYEGLLDDIFDHGVLPRDMLIFLLHPSVTDPSLAPPGKSTFRALIPVANQSKLPIDWDQAGPLIEKRILDEVGRRLIPDLGDRIVTSFHYAPRDFALDLNAWAGSAYGLQGGLARSLSWRLPGRDAKIRNFYLAGAGTQPGGGIPGAIAGAKAVARSMLTDLRDGRP